MAEETTLQELRDQLDELDEHTLQGLVSDSLARRHGRPSGREQGLAEAERRFGKSSDQTAPR